MAKHFFFNHNNFICSNSDNHNFNGKININYNVAADDNNENNFNSNNDDNNDYQLH